MRTFDIVFHDDNHSQNKGFRVTFKEAITYLVNNNGKGNKDFDDWIGGTVQIINNDTLEVAHEETVKKKQGRPRTNFKEIKLSSETGTKVGDIRATFIVNEIVLSRIREHSMKEGKLLKDIVNEAFTLYLTKQI